MTERTWKFDNFLEMYPRERKNVRTWLVEYIDTKVDSEVVLVLLHGTVGTPEIFWPQIMSLGEKQRIISLDAPACSNINELVALFQQLLKSLDVDTYVLGGTSFGGYVAQWMAQKHPQCIKGLILGNTFHDNTILRTQNRMAARLLPFLPASVLKRIMAKGIQKDLESYSEHHGFTEYMKKFFPTLSSEKIKARLKIVLQQVRSVPQVQGTIPVLLILTENDPLIPRDAQDELKSTYPRAQVEIFPPKAGHFPYLTDPVRYSQLLENFLQEIHQG